MANLSDSLRHAACVGARHGQFHLASMLQPSDECHRSSGRYVSSFEKQAWVMHMLIVITTFGCKQA